MLESPNASLDQPLVLEVEGGARRRGTPAILMGQSANDQQRYSTILVFLYFCKMPLKIILRADFSLHLAPYFFTCLCSSSSSFQMDHG
jgi:hypothetical protein